MGNVRLALGRRIKVLRELQGLTQERLGEKAELSGKFIGEVERGKANPSIETLAKIADALNTPVTKLLEEEEERQGLLSISKQDLAVIRKALRILEKIFAEEIP